MNWLEHRGRVGQQPGRVSSPYICLMVYSLFVPSLSLAAPPRIADQSVWDLWYSSDGDALFTVGMPKDGNDTVPRVRRWGAEVSPRDSFGEMEPSKGSAGIALSAAMSMDGNFVATYYAETILTPGRPRFRSVLCVWSKDGKKVADLPTTFESGVAGIVFSPDGSLLAVAGGETNCATEVFDVKRSVNVATLQGHLHRQWATEPERPIAVSRVAFSPDGRFLATGGGAGSVRVWSVPKFELIAKADLHLVFLDKRIVNDITGLVFTPDSSSIISSSCDGNVIIYEARTGRGVRTIPVRPLPDGKLKLETLPVAIALSHDGTRLATVASNRLALWEVKTGKLLAETVEGKSRLERLVYSPDGTEIAAPRQTRGVVRWRVTSDPLVLELK